MFTPEMIGSTHQGGMYQFTGCYDEVYYMSMVGEEWRIYFDKKPDTPDSKWCDYTIRLSNHVHINTIIAEAVDFAEDVITEHLLEYTDFSNTLIRNYADYVRKQKIDNLLK